MAYISIELVLFSMNFDTKTNFVAYISINLVFFIYRMF